MPLSAGASFLTGLEFGVNMRGDVVSKRLVDFLRFEMYTKWLSRRELKKCKLPNPRCSRPPLTGEQIHKEVPAAIAKVALIKTWKV